MDSPQQKFFVSDDGKDRLSLSKAELQAGIDSGKHTDETLAWTKGMGEWLPLSDQSWEKHGIVIEPQPPELPPSGQDLAHYRKASLGIQQFETSQDRSPNTSDEESKKRQVIIRKWIFIVAFLVVVIGGIWFYVDYNSGVSRAERRIKELERMQEVLDDALDSLDY